jgi:hypothetical protein
MDNDFLDGIDEAYQKLMNLNGNGKRNGHSVARSKEDGVISEIINRLEHLSKSKKEEVLNFVRSLDKPEGE